jgi:hypothetical protein
MRAAKKYTTRFAESHDESEAIEALTGMNFSAEAII